MKFKIVTVEGSLPWWGRRAAQASVVACLLAASAAAFGVPNEFRSRTPVSAKELNDNFKALEARVQALEAGSAPGDLPSGTIVAFAGAIVPAGWALCDGADVDGTDTKFGPLYAAIGTSFGGNPASKRFLLPDLRGRFLRGVTDGATAVRDTDAANRTPSGPGGNAGAKVGSFEGWSTGMPRAGLVTVGAGTHAHGANIVRWTGGAGGTHYVQAGANGIYLNGSTDPVGDHVHGISGGDAESRPDNVTVNYIIRL